MQSTRIEHVNITVSDPDATAKLLSEIFGWTVRWSGSSINDGRTVHVGTEDDYLALYSPKDATKTVKNTYTTRRALNHVGVVVDDIDACEERVRACGLTPGLHSDYPKGRRFYFVDHDDVEYEVVSKGYEVD